MNEIIGKGLKKFMRYASIRSMDISNGEGIGVALFVQGCHFHCKDCFNPETWDFQGGEDWTEDTKNTFFQLCKKPYVKRVSILGGEPLANENVETVLELVKEIGEKFPDKKIWIYTGYKWESILFPIVTDNLDFEREKILEERREVLNYIDILVDGRFDTEKKDVNLKWKGSWNQRVIDVRDSLKQEKIVEKC